MSTSEKHQSGLGRVRITKTHVDRLSLSDQLMQNQAFLRDSELRGFGVRVTSTGAKSFIVEKRVNGRVRRVTIGRYPDLTVEQARKEAQKHLGDIARGIDPAMEKAKERSQAVTLAQAFDVYLTARRALKPKTAYDYGRILEKAFPDWINRPLISITKDAVAKRHLRLGEDSGTAYANLCMRVLRAIFNFAIYQYELPTGERMLLFNPVERLTQTRSWYRVARRQTVIKPHQLKAWNDAVEALRLREPGGHAGRVADYLHLLLYSGLRRSEAAELKWADIDLTDRTLKISDPKNHQPLVVPLSDVVLELLERRARETFNEYVFPSPGKRGYLIEVRNQLEWTAQQSGVSFTLHDLRRTFVTTAERLDISAYAIKRLVNHKTSALDVTAGYVVLDVDRLRPAMQRITDELRRHISNQSEPTVVPMVRKA